MKKVFALMAVAAMFAVSCSKDDDKDSSVVLKGISLSQTTLALEEGQEAALTVTLSPENTTEKPAITWASDKEAVATVVGGKVTAVAAGEANITATAGKFTATCKVTVTAKAGPAFPEPVQGTSDWSVIGALLGTNWDTDFVMAQDGNIFVLKNVQLAAADKFKIRYQKNWDVNRGGVFAALGEGFEVVDKGADIAPGLDGIYDIYYNADVEKMAVVAKDGTPAWGAAAASITIDGDFADWAAMDESKVKVSRNDPDSPWEGVLELRVYADAEHVFYYIKFDKESLDDAFTLDPNDMHLRLCLNTDDEFESGYSSYFLESYDFIIEGTFAEGGAFVDFDGEFHQRFGSWVSLLAPENGLVSGKGAGCEYEIAMNIAKFNEAANTSTDPKPMGDHFQTGVRFYYNGWEEFSNIPNSSIEEEAGNGWGYLMRVTLDK